MADKPTTGGVDMNTPLIPQRKRIAAGAKLTGQSLDGGKVKSASLPKEKAKVKK